MEYNVYVDDFYNQVAIWMEEAGFQDFPWIRSVPIEDKQYMVEIKCDDYDYERNVYSLRVVITIEDLNTGESETIEVKEECHETDLDQYLKDHTEFLREMEFYPNEGDDMFDVDIYDYATETHTPDEMYQFVMTKCKEAKKYYMEEAKRQFGIETIKKAAGEESDED